MPSQSAAPPAASPPPPVPPAQRRLWMPVFMGTLLPVVLLCALGVYALMQSRAQYEQRAEVLTRNLAEAMDRSVSANIDKIDLVLGTIVDQLQMELAAGGLNLDAARNQIRMQIVRRAELQGARVTDASGSSLLNLGVEGRGFPDPSQEDWFAALRDRPDSGMIIGSPRFDEASGTWSLLFSRRYVDARQAFAGVVSLTVPLSLFAHEVQAIDVGPHGTVVLRDDQLRLLARSSRDTRSVAEKVGGRTVSETLRQQVAAGHRQGTFHTRWVGDGVERVLSFRMLRAAPMLVLVGLGTEDYLADWYGEVRVVAGFCVGVILLYGVGSLLLLRMLAQNRQARRRIDLLANVFEYSGEAIVMTDGDNRIIEVNPAFVRQTGYSPREIVGCNPNVLASGRTTNAQYEAMWASLQSTGHWRGELWDRTKAGREFPKWMSISAVRDAGGRVTHHIASFIDMTEMKEAEAKILHLAQHDTLTRLPNRVYLHARLEQAMSSARREGQELAMLFIDMDRFKNINDTLGHQVGDGLLIEVGQRLRGVVRESDIVARLGGDEFVVVLTGIGLDGAGASASVATKIKAILGQPYLVRGHELHSTPSIGISLFPTDGTDADALMKTADTAMYHAKSTGRNNFQFYTPAMNVATAERLGLEVGLRTAIERDEFFLNYQPQRDLRTGRVVGMEALVRWHHPERGLIPPLKFIPVAEDTGQIEAIGAWVLDQALAHIAYLRSAGWDDLRVAVNLSAQQLRGDGFATLVAQALKRHGLPGAALELEVTESTAMRDPTRTALMLRRLRAHGVALAIDDFGTGYSSLAYLKQLPLSCLKLDRSFVMDIERDPNDAAICTATIQLAHSLGLSVVAEGVESAAQLAFLRALDCDTVQGYYVSRPLAAEACESFLRSEESEPEATQLGYFS